MYRIEPEEPRTDLTKICFLERTCAPHAVQKYRTHENYPGSGQKTVRESSRF